MYSLFSVTLLWMPGHLSLQCVYQSIAVSSTFGGRFKTVVLYPLAPVYSHIYTAFFIYLWRYVRINNAGEKLGFVTTRLHS